MEIALILVGLAVGTLLGYLMGKSPNKPVSKDDTELKELTQKVSVLNSTLAEKEGRLETSRQHFQELRTEKEEYKTKVDQLTSDNATHQTNARNLQEKLKEEQANWEERKNQMLLEFKNLSNEALRENTTQFNKQNTERLGILLNPLKERIESFEKKVGDTHKESGERIAALKEQLHQVKELNQTMTKEAENLVNALKADTKAQGNWGEMILERILENSGLKKGETYKVQESAVTDEGRRLQPDVVVHLPEEKFVIIDSKVSLVAYERYTSSSTDEERQAALKQHLLSIKNHIKGLSEKNYQNLKALSGLDFVFLFIPIEPAFSLAIQEDDNLYHEAYNRNIILVTPTTLMATLRVIANIWKQEDQNKNAMEIAKQSGDLYDKFVGFIKDMEKIDRGLQTAQGAYDDAMNKLHQGRGNLVKRAEDIKKLGANTSKAIDAKLLE